MKSFEGQIFNINDEKLVLVCAKICNYRPHAELYKWKQNEITDRSPTSCKEEEMKGILACGSGLIFG